MLTESAARRVTGTGAERAATDARKGDTAELGWDVVLGKQPVQLGAFARLPLSGQPGRKDVEGVTELRGSW